MIVVDTSTGPSRRGAACLSMGAFVGTFFDGASICLVTASSASGGGLGIGGDVVQDFALLHHLREVDIRALGVLVSAFTRVESTGVGAVSFEGFKGVEVGGRAGGLGVPGAVNIQLRVHIPKLTVVLSGVLVEELGAEDRFARRSKGRRRSDKGENEGVLELGFRAKGEEMLDMKISVDEEPRLQTYHDFDFGFFQRKRIYDKIHQRVRGPAKKNPKKRAAVVSQRYQSAYAWGRSVFSLSHARRKNPAGTVERQCKRSHPVVQDIMRGSTHVFLTAAPCATKKKKKASFIATEAKKKR